ncbi:MAG: hypothetical protein NXI31_17605 [bacterium]|nr:hypothetical protein [bacterium]
MTASVLATAFVVFGLQQPDDRILNVQFQNGTYARVQVLEVRGEAARLRLLALDGSIEVKHELDEFESESAFRLQLAARPPKSFDDHFWLVRRAARLELPNEMSEHVARALERLHEKKSPEQARGLLESFASRQLRRWLGQAIESERIEDSVTLLERLSTRFANTVPEAELEEFAAAVEELENDRSARRRAERQARLDQKIRKHVEKRLEPIRRTVQRGDGLLRQAIAKSRQMTKSANLASKAIDTYRSAWRTASALQQKFPQDKPLAVEIESLANHLHDHSIRAALHAANTLTVRSDFVGAMEWVQQVLALDPSNREAREMRQTIAVAGAAASGPWGWGLGNGNPLTPGSGQ